MCKKKISLSCSKKQEQVERITNFIDDFASIVIVNYQSNSVAKISELRKKLRSIQSIFIVSTNNIIKRAFSKKKFLFNENVFSGMNALVFLKNTMAGLKMLADFCKESKLVIKSGVIDGKISDYNYIMKLALIPSRKEIMSKIVSCLNTTTLVVNNFIKALKEENKKA
ncbi:MAG: 50S ribosomal protein L10 [Bacilli bacterium]|nr:50S ribosomal protein L10 [Bacilli bacterium]